MTRKKATVTGLELFHDTVGVSTLQLGLSTPLASVGSDKVAAFGQVPVGERLRCREVSAVYDAEQLLWPGWPTDPDAAADDGGTAAIAPGSMAGCEGCAASGRAPIGLLSLLLLPVLIRRRS